MSEQLSRYQRRIHAQRQARLRPAGAAAQWQPDGRFELRRSYPVTTKSQEEAIAELKAAVADGADMPWCMIGLNWDAARAILDAFESR